jgi:hypothetical protein
MKSGNPKSFWNTVKQLQGDSKSKHRDMITLSVGDKIVTDESEVANEMAKFFEDKVLKLSNHREDYNWTRSSHTLKVTTKELENHCALDMMGSR